MNAATHFDRRATTYDADETHRRIISILLSRAPLQPGMQVLDMATGTGAAALKAASVVGPQGSVVGIDISDAMLAEARQKATAAGLQNVEFACADAEGPDATGPDAAGSDAAGSDAEQAAPAHFEHPRLEHFDSARFAPPPASFDCILCASALVLMRDIPRALRRWARWLRPGGYLAFDVPAKPFGISQIIAEAAAHHGILLPYDTVADTPAKCRSLLENAGLEVTAIHTEVVSNESMEVTRAIAFLDERLDHPAWRALHDAPESTRDAIRETFVTTIAKNATANRIESKVVQNFAYGRKP